MEERHIFTESPEEEMWQTVLQFSYSTNIIKHLAAHGHVPNDALVENISGSILQAHEYFQSSKNVSLQISPLLLYYGAINLLNGFSNLITGKINEIKHHGMRVDLPNSYQYIAEASIRFDNGAIGGIHVFSRAFGYSYNLCNWGDWSIMEILGSIAELNPDFCECYPNSEFYVLSISDVKTENAITERIPLGKLDASKFAQMFNDVPNSSQSYLRPNVSQNNEAILRHKLNSKRITELSHSNQKYLQVGHRKKK